MPRPGNFVFGGVCGACVLALVPRALPAAQPQEFKLEGSAWVPGRVPTPGSDEAIIADARRDLARGEFLSAQNTLDQWLDIHEHESDNAWLPTAYLLRGDALLARGREEMALADYEEVVEKHPDSDCFPVALEREHDVALKYLGGLRRKVLGLRIDTGVPLAEDILVRVGERLPRSRLAERSLLALADFYYSSRDLSMSIEAYDTFLVLYGPTWWQGKQQSARAALDTASGALPAGAGGNASIDAFRRLGSAGGAQSEYSAKAIQRLTYSYIARFKGPRYDATPLHNAREIIRRARERDPSIFERDGMGEALESRLEESTAAQMLLSARYYLTRDDPVSARLTLRRLIAKHPQTAAATRAIELMERHQWPLAPRRAPRGGAAPASDITPTPEGSQP